MIASALVQQLCSWVLLGAADAAAEGSAAGEAAADTGSLKASIIRWLSCPTFWALLVGAVGLGLALPRGNRRGKVFGTVLGILSLGLFLTDAPWVGQIGPQATFWILALVTLVAAAATITSQSPVYSAIWFALSLLGTAGLFFFQGAQFLGVATIVVYAGAIVVTFLFVIMLAQPEGHSSYDRITWGPATSVVSVIAAATMVGLLTMQLGTLRTQAENGVVAAAAPSPSDAAEKPAGDAAASAEKPLQAKNPVLEPDHMAHLGGYLFSRHLVSIELAGTLLLAGLVGAVAIAIQGKPKLATRMEEALR
ncbi:MAG: NADH-quinone oxidoreductase subunit J [Planctomycetaceae bacterium]